MSRGAGTRILLRTAVVGALLTCLHAVPAHAAPTLTIDSGPDGPTKNRTPTFEFTVLNATTVECSVDQDPEMFGPCTSASSHTADALADGGWTFRVRATDDTGSTVKTRNFTVDTVGPAATIAGPKKTGNRRPTFHVSSSEPDATFTCKLDDRPSVSCGAGGNDPYAEAFSPRRKLKPGMHTLVATAFDALGNRGPPDQLRFRVLRRPLKAGRAKRTVRTALRRHKFAKRVISNLEQSCARRGRFRFSCRFSSAFPGYRLTGRGPVELQRGRVSYRFRVRAQGQRIVLTDENEGRFPG